MTLQQAEAAAEAEAGRGTGSSSGYVDGDGNCVEAAAVSLAVAAYYRDASQCVARGISMGQVIWVGNNGENMKNLR